MKASVERALTLLDRQSFSGVADYKRHAEFNRDFVNPGGNPYGYGIGHLSFDQSGVTDYWAEDDDGIARHFLLKVTKDGDVEIEELEITEDEL